MLHRSDVIAVQFKPYGATDEFAGPFSVRASDLDSFLDGRGNVLADGVIFDHKYPFSYGKSWWETKTYTVCMIGAGAYGDCTVWTKS